MIVLDRYTYDVTAYGRRQRGVYTVARLDGPTPATFAGAPVVIVALDWHDECWAQMAILADGRRVPLGRVEIAP